MRSNRLPRFSRILSESAFNRLSIYIYRRTDVLLCIDKFASCLLSMSRAKVMMLSALVTQTPNSGIITVGKVAIFSIKGTCNKLNVKPVPTAIASNTLKM